jgi:cytosine/adenosine deaminase-related metal-dependent hydrolase
MPAELVFELATRSGAEALGILDQAGSLEAGKFADIVFLDTDRIWNGADPRGRIYSTIVHTASAENVRDVMIDGRWVYRNGKHTTLDEDRTARLAREELGQLLRRTDGMS